MKLDVVSRDEREEGLRAVAEPRAHVRPRLESATGYESSATARPSGSGCCVALRLSELEAGLEPGGARVRPRAARHAWPSDVVHGPSTDELLGLYAADKKRRGDRQNLVLLREPGDVIVGAEVPSQESPRRSTRYAGAGSSRLSAVGANRIEVLHGVNLDMLGKRDPAHYGTLTLIELEVRIRHWARDLGLEASFFQTNHEGEFVERLHQAPETGRRPVLNPGAWTHYS